MTSSLGDLAVKTGPRRLSCYRVEESELQLTPVLGSKPSNCMLQRPFALDSAYCGGRGGVPRREA